MTDQLGFMFVEAAMVTSNEQPAGTWTQPSFNWAELDARLASARAVLEAMSGPVRVVMALGLDAFERAWANRGDSSEQGGEVRREFCEVQVMASVEDITAWIHLCENQSGVLGSSMRYAVREFDGVQTSGQYIEGLGSLVLRQWTGLSVEGDDERATETLEFMPWRDSLFLEHFRVENDRVACPISVWARAYAAEKLSPASGVRCNAPTFLYEGREYVNSGMMFKGAYAQCKGWSLVPLEDWRGLVYSYSMLCMAWDDGRLARGDLRGLEVWVKGQACVLESMVLFYDREASVYGLGNDESTEVDELVDSEAEAESESDVDSEA